MNRVLKFRAWTGEKMMIAFDLSQNPKYWFKKNHDYPLMQFTGLLDKNGKEIYEGDVVCVDDTWTETVDVGVGSVPVAQTPDNHLLAVDFDGGEFGVYAKENKDVLSKGWYSLRSLIDEVGAEGFEVIGNIYENPELINHV